MREPCHVDRVAWDFLVGVHRRRSFDRERGHRCSASSRCL